MHRMTVLGVVVFACSVWVLPSVPLGAEEQEKQTAHGNQHDSGHGEGDGNDDDRGHHENGGADDMAAMMEAFVKMAAPGEHHEHLKSLSGQWITVGKYRMAPGAPWAESKSECTSKWILGGRFLTQNVKGEPMLGMPSDFEGFGLLGYDNATRKHTYVWMDNFGTMTMSGEGQCTDNGRVTTYVSKFLDPMSGQQSTMKSVYRIESPDRYVLEMYGPDPNGGEFLSMKLTSTRKD